MSPNMLLVTDHIEGARIAHHLHAQRVHVHVLGLDLGMLAASLP